MLVETPPNIPFIEYVLNVYFYYDVAKFTPLTKDTGIRQGKIA